MVPVPRSVQHAAILTLALALGVAVAWFYAPTVGFDFVMFDDDINLYQNPHLGDLTAERIQWAFTDRTYMHRFMPLGWLAWCGLLSAGGLDPAVYHAANVALHAVNAVLVFVLVFQVLRLLPSRTGSGRDPLATALVSGLAALLWAVHPLRVEVVAWSSGLLYLQATAWALVSGSLFVAALRSTRRRNAVLHGFAILAFALSVATYPVALGWPFALLAVAFLLPRTNDEGRGRSAWITPVATLALALAGVLAAIGARVAVTSHWSAPEGLAEYSLAERVGRAGFALLYYLWGHAPLRTLTPVTEFFQVGSAARAWLWPSVALVAIAFTALVWRRTHWRGTALWALAFTGVAGPFLGVLDRGFEPADRYTYLPSVAIVAGLAALIQSSLWRSPAGSAWSGSSGERQRVGVRARWIAVVALVFLAAAVPWLAWGTRAQLPVWRDSGTLYTHITAHLRHETARAVYLARKAVYHTRQGEDAASRTLLGQARALADNPADLAVYVDLIERLRLRAREASDRPVPPSAVEAMSLAINAAKQANRAGARAHFERALALAPTYFEARYNFTLWLARNGGAVEADRQREILEASGDEFTPALRERVREALTTASSRQQKP